MQQNFVWHVTLALEEFQAEPAVNTVKQGVSSQNVQRRRVMLVQQENFSALQVRGTVLFVNLGISVA